MGASGVPLPDAGRRLRGPTLNLGSLPWSAAHRLPAATALHWGRERLTHGDLDRASHAMRVVLRRRGLRSGERVALLMRNGPTVPIAYYGALRGGSIVVPLSIAAPPLELGASLRRLRVSLLLADDEHAPLAAAALDVARTGARRLVVGEGRRRGSVSLASLVAGRSADPLAVAGATPAVLLATSGTTGTPRWAVHSHAGLLLNARMVATELLALRPDDIQLGALPMAHSFGMSAVLNASILAGASVALLPHPDVGEALSAIDALGVTVLQGVPTFLRRLAEASPRPRPSLQTVVVSGAPLPAPTATAIWDRLCPTLVERYGMTEVSPLTMRIVPRDGGEPGDVGRPLAGVVVRVSGHGGDGELEASSPTLFLGYAGDRVATAASVRGGFFLTGDVGRVTADGTVVLTGRRREIILRGGNTIAAREVERVLESHPDVAEAAVVGIPDAELGEEVAAMVVARRRGALSIADLERHCADRLATYKQPRRWLLVDALPRTSSGKVRIAEVRERFAEEA
jgi:long-chain acyl-CoA synthetase